MKRILGIALALFMVLSSFAVAAEQKKAEDLTIAALVHIENQWGAMLTAGYEAAAADMGIKELYVSNYNNDDAKMVELLDTYYSMGVDAIMTNPSDPTVAILNSYAASGVAIGTTNLIYDSLTGTTVKCAYSQYDLGKACAETALRVIEERLNGEVHMAVISVRQGSAVSDMRDAGFVEQIQDAYPGAQVENQSYTMKNDEALQHATDMLTANPKLNVIFGGCEAGVVGAVQAVRNLGLQGKVFVFGVDASEQMCQMLMADDEILWALGGQDSYAMAYQGMTSLIKRVTGQETSEPGAVDYCAVPALNRDNPEEILAFIEMLRTYQG